MAQQKAEEYTCPYCRWNKAHHWTHTREEEELIDRKYLGQDYSETYYLDTKKKFNVRICDRCHSALKVRSVIIWILLGCMTVTVFTGIITAILNKLIGSEVLDRFGGLAVVVAMCSLISCGLFELCWKVFARTRVHADYERALKSNAIDPYLREMSPDKVAE